MKEKFFLIHKIKHYLCDGIVAKQIAEDKGSITIKTSDNRLIQIGKQNKTYLGKLFQITRKKYEKEAAKRWERETLIATMRSGGHYIGKLFSPIEMRNEKGQRVILNPDALLSLKPIKKNQRGKTICLKRKVCQRMRKIG